MAQGLVTGTSLTDIADAIREGNGTATTYLPSEMAGAVRSINVGKKDVQTAVADPTADGSALEFISTISQDEQGVITPTKKTVAVDSTPTEGSTNPLTSGGAHTALAGKQDTLTIDTALNDTSTNPVQNAAVATAVSTLDGKITEIENLLPYSTSWGKLQFLSRTGVASTYMDVGDQITDTYTDPDASTTTEYTQVWDVLDFRDVTLSDASTRHATIIGTHYTQLVSMQFSGWQALLYSETGLPAGTYNFVAGSSWGSKGLVANTAYQFTLENALPAGGQIVGVKQWPDTAIASWTVSTYASATSETAIETVSVTEGSDGTALGTVNLIVPTDTTTVTIDGTDYTYRFNGMHQAGYGCNRWRDSAVRQYLNSDAAAGEWWTPQHVFDRAPDIASTNAGWLAGCTDEFKEALTPILVQTALPTALASSEGITYDETYDKVFLPSLTEHYISPQIAEGTEFEYWAEINGTTTKFPTGTATDVLKTYSISNHSTIAVRWLRSANRGYGCYEYYVGSAGNVVSGTVAPRLYSLAPVCAIC